MMENKAFWVVIMIVNLLAIALVVNPNFGNTAENQYQIVEKGEYNRIQYITADGVMTPEFVDGHYIIVRNGDTGREDKVEVSQEEYNSCVVGDTVDNVNEWR